MAGDLLQRLFFMLEELEFSARIGIVRACPLCRKTTHAPRCRLEALLREAKAQVL